MASAEWSPSRPPNAGPCLCRSDQPHWSTATRGRWNLGNVEIVHFGTRALGQRPSPIGHSALYCQADCPVGRGMGGGWSDIYPTQTEDHKGDNDSLIQTRRYFRRVFYISTYTRHTRIDYSKTYYFENVSDIRRHP